jgi:hypothetical protein
MVLIALHPLPLPAPVFTICARNILSPAQPQIVKWRKVPILLPAMWLSPVPCNKWASDLSLVSVETKRALGQAVHRHERNERPGCQFL